MDKSDIILTLVLFYFVFLAFRLSKRYEDPIRQNEEGYFKDEYKHQSQWSDWSGWSSCSVSCGLGRRVRRRQCVSMVTQRRMQSIWCDQNTHAIEEQPCSLASCPNGKATKHEHSDNADKFRCPGEGNDHINSEEDESEGWKRRQEWQQYRQCSGGCGTESEGPTPPCVEQLNQEEELHTDVENPGEEEQFEEEAEHNEEEHQDEKGNNWEYEEAYSTADEKEGGQQEDNDPYDSIDEEEEQDDREDELVKKKKKKKKRKQKSHKEKDETKNEAQY